MKPTSFPETPSEALGELTCETVLLDEHTFIIERPRDSDRLIDHPALREAFAADEYMPYWADLWPAARMLARAVLREPWQPGLTALEIGCGLGLPGIAALARGLRVTFSDIDATALRFAADNARRNGFMNFELLQLDWRHPPDELQVPVVLASDLIFERRHVEPLAELISRVLAPNGIALLTDQDRPPAPYLRDALAANGLTFTTEMMRAGSPGGNRVKGTLYRIQRNSVG
jgi:predicted nicotinamide N-methyase